MNEHEYRDETVGNAIRSLPTPAASEGFDARLESRLAAAAHESGFLRRVKPRRAGRAISGRSALAVSVIAAALVVGGVAGGLLASPSSGATSPVPVFEPTLGWNTFEANVGYDARLPVAFAANVPFQPPDISSPDIPPTATLKNLAANGIVIAVGGPWTYTGKETPPRLHFPLQLSQLHFFSSNYEGQPAPNVATYQISGWANSTQIAEVFVWIGTNHPTQDMINAANEELDRLQMPS